MALKEPFMVFHGLGSNEYTLSPGYNEGIVIKKIYVPRPVDDFLVIYIQKTLAGFWSLGAVNPGNNLYYPGKQSWNAFVDPVQEFPAFLGGEACDENVYNYFVELGLFRPYRVAEGETITFRTLNKTNFELIVQYEVYDSADVDPAEPNGSKSDEYDFVNYIAVSYPEPGDKVFDMTWDPSEFPAFPVGERVPADYQITIWGIVGIPVLYLGGTSSNLRTTAVKIVRNRKVLFDEAKKGIPFYGAPEGTYIGVEDCYLTVTSSLIRGHSQIDQHHALILPQPIVAEPGEELEFRLVLEGNYSLSSQYQKFFTIGLLETVKRVR